MVEFPGAYGRRPALVLTREVARAGLTSLTVAPITSRVRGLSSELTILRSYGVDHDSVATLDNVATVGGHTLGRVLGYLPDAREPDLFRAIVHTFDLSEY